MQVFRVLRPLEAPADQPLTAVAWEDLHWADPSTLEMLGLVLEQTPTVPMLHVLTSRPAFTPLWPTRFHLTPLTLNRLERPQVEALITHLAGGRRCPPRWYSPWWPRRTGCRSMSKS
jgi:predicted ATPase